MTTLPLNISEENLQAAVIDLALLRGWRVAHFRAAQTARGWRTPLTGHPGSPDLLLARDGLAISAELKSQHGRVRPEQQEWLTALGGSGRLWRPSSWREICDELR